MTVLWVYTHKSIIIITTLYFNTHKFLKDKHEYSITFICLF